jgi:hypothetical protein
MKSSKAPVKIIEIKTGYELVSAELTEAKVKRMVKLYKEIETPVKVYWEKAA